VRYQDAALLLQFEEKYCFYGFLEVEKCDFYIHRRENNPEKESEILENSKF
jgi:hypothetical protein